MCVVCTDRYVFKFILILSHLWQNCKILMTTIISRYYYMVGLLCIIVSRFLLKIQAIEVFGAERIGHGYRVLEDETVYRLARERNIHFEVYTSHVILV